MIYQLSNLNLQQRIRRKCSRVQRQDRLLTNGQENDFYRINRIIYQPSMHNNRQFIFTEPRLRSQYRSTFSHQRASQKAKNKQNINVPETFQLYGSDEVDRKQMNFLQNEGVSYSTPNFSNPPAENQPEKAKFYKFQTIEKINQCNDNEQKTAEDNPKKTLLKKQSTTKCFYQKIHTQIINQIQNNEEVLVRRQVERKSNKRKKCRIRSKEEYEQECQKFIVKKEKQQVEDLFRHVNREMKLSLKRKEGNNFYQKIRKNAIKKINYMSYNQKYYDNCEVQHLNSVVQNCNILIHKRDCKIDAKPLYQTLKHRQLTEYKDNFVAESSQSITKYSNTQKQLPSRRTSKNKASIIKTVIQEKQPPSVQSHKNSYFRYKGSHQSSRMKTQRLRQQTQILTNKMNKIVDSCSQQQHNMQQVKKGMKIFEFYCNKVDQGFNSRQNKLNNFLKWEEIDQ